MAWDDFANFLAKWPHIPTNAQMHIIKRPSWHTPFADNAAIAPRAWEALWENATKAIIENPFGGPHEFVLGAILARNLESAHRLLVLQSPMFGWALGSEEETFALFLHHNHLTQQERQLLLGRRHYSGANRYLVEDYWDDTKFQLAMLESYAPFHQIEALYRMPVKSRPALEVLADVIAAAPLSRGSASVRWMTLRLLYDHPGLSDLLSERHAGSGDAASGINSIIRQNALTTSIVWTGRIKIPRRTKPAPLYALELTPREHRVGELLGSNEQAWYAFLDFVERHSPRADILQMATTAATLVGTR
jgi:hypothetical protein